MNSGRFRSLLDKLSFSDTIGLTLVTGSDHKFDRALSTNCIADAANAYWIGRSANFELRAKPAGSVGCGVYNN